MQLILKPETVQITSKMTDLDVTDSFEEKSVTNGMIENKITNGTTNENSKDNETTDFITKKENGEEFSKNGKAENDNFEVTHNDLEKSENSKQKDEPKQTIIESSGSSNTETISKPLDEMHIVNEKIDIKLCTKETVDTNIVSLPEDTNENKNNNVEQKHCEDKQDKTKENTLKLKETDEPSSTCAEMVLTDNVNVENHTNNKCEEPIWNSFTKENSEAKTSDEMKDAKVTNDTVVTDSSNYSSSEEKINVNDKINFIEKSNSDMKVDSSYKQDKDDNASDKQVENIEKMDICNMVGQTKREISRELLSEMKTMAENVHYNKECEKPATEQNSIKINIQNCDTIIETFAEDELNTFHEEKIEANNAAEAKTDEIEKDKSSLEDTTEEIVVEKDLGDSSVIIDSLSETKSIKIDDQESDTSINTTLELPNEICLKDTNCQKEITTEAKKVDVVEGKVEDKLKIVNSQKDSEGIIESDCEVVEEDIMEIDNLQNNINQSIIKSSIQNSEQDGNNAQDIATKSEIEAPSTVIQSNMPKNENMDIDDFENEINQDVSTSDNFLCSKKHTNSKEKEEVKNSESTIKKNQEELIKNKDVDKSETDDQLQEQASKTRICSLSNTLNIISDDEDEPERINDEDVMVIDVDTKKENESEDSNVVGRMPTTPITEEQHINKKECQNENNTEETLKTIVEEKPPTDSDPIPASESLEIVRPDINEKSVVTPTISPKLATNRPLVPENFLKTFKTSVAEMTRDELEEFCLLKIVEGVVDRSNLSEIKAKLKTISQNMDEWRKKSMMLTKQNRDLQIVLKTVQEEQKKKSDVPITPLKITRSVGMQVFMTENVDRGGLRRKGPLPNPRNNRTPCNAVTRPPKPNNNTAIPVPKLVPATTVTPTKIRPAPVQQVQNSTVSSNSGKVTSPNFINGPKPQAKAAEKRSFSTVQATTTVDLTDDEPPTKQQVTPRNAPQPPVRLVSQQQLLTPQAVQFSQNMGGPRKVYIPINSQNPGIRPGQTITIKPVMPTSNPRHRAPILRMPQNGGIMFRSNKPKQINQRHPASLPESINQPQPPDWKALPPAPDLKISKVENGIVISWKIEGYQDDSYEEIASYQLYAYQETQSPPSTLLWKKIGDVKALPLPMACTLTQFMAGYKYYFAVRAVDVRSRIGQFSLPGSILLLNK